MQSDSEMNNGSIERSNQARPTAMSGLPYSGGSGSFEMTDNMKMPPMRRHPGHAIHHPVPTRYHHHKFHSTTQPQQLHAVVTSSFSVEDEREDVSMSRMAAHRPSAVRTNFVETRSNAEEDRVSDRCNDYDGRVPPPDYPPGPSPSMIPPSPSEANSRRPTIVRRSASAIGYNDFHHPSSARQQPMKRSFWHHAKPGDYYATSMHPEFLPPKRPKMSGPPKADIVLTPRTPMDEALEAEHRGYPLTRQDSWFSRTLSWSVQHEGEGDYNRMVHRSQSYPAPWGSPPQPPQATPSPPGRERGWFEAGRHPAPSPSGAGGDRPSPHGPPPMYSPANRQYSGPWHSDFRPPAYPRHGPPSPHSRGMVPTWSNAPAHAVHHREEDEANANASWYSARDAESSHRGGIDPRRQGTFESERQNSEASYSPSSPYHNKAKQPLPAEPICQGSTIITEEGTKIRLLALPEDRISLSETLCVVRENIEVFTATTEDVEAPAPGRKHAVVVGQVGLRCIHCRHTTRTSDRVKRAVCYPSSMKRIYRTVIDMKLDHFLHCKFVPPALKERLTELKAINTRSTGTTMQYFIRAAKSIGMIDGPSGVRLLAAGAAAMENGESKRDVPPSTTPLASSTSPSPPREGVVERSTPRSPDSTPSEDGGSGNFETSSLDNDVSTGSPEQKCDAVATFAGKIPLALAEDKMSLSPLRCFLREQVCAFSATEEDIAVRTPTTFSVSLGQVGIGCIHCLHQPAKLRSNRAVCFPFSISRIYQSVADIQRFHLGECKMLPPTARDKFVELQNASSKGSKGLATRQYWVTSAKKIGLVDTDKGIRFGRDPTIPTAPAVSLDILAQVASNVTTANRPLVLPSDKPYIAEFLYVVMDQLQPCRFTEADRNKRRLKDVGCIGVECRHCAGQVESRKFFWSSVNAVESNFVSVHTHMMECRMIPQEMKDKLSELKMLRKEQTAALKTGSQKAFFSRVWSRLHGDDEETINNLRAEDFASSEVEDVKSVLQKMSMVSV